MKKTLVIICMTFSMLGIAQNDATSVKGQMFKAKLFMPGIEYEIGLTQKTSLNLAIGTGLSVIGGSNRDTEFGVFPVFGGSYRYYYNFEKRASKNKKTSFNSGNYLALVSSFTSTEPIIGDIEANIDYSLAVGPVWGLQRTYNSKLNIDLQLGLGYAFDDQNNYITPIVGFSLGWVIGK